MVRWQIMNFCCSHQAFLPCAQRSEGLNEPSSGRQNRKGSAGQSGGLILSFKAPLMHAGMVG